MAKRVAAEVLEATETTDVAVIESDGSYLFNLLFHDFGSYNDLEIFCKALGEQRGLCALPYKTGVVRFSLGGYLDGSARSYEIFEKEIRTALTLFLGYWKQFRTVVRSAGNGGDSEVLIKEVFPALRQNAWMDAVLEDFKAIRDLKKQSNKSLKINDNRSLYHASPQRSEERRVGKEWKAGELTGCCTIVR